MGTNSVIEVYHGGTEIIEHPLVNVGRPGLDFGQGFYVTLWRDQAELWADRMARQRRANKVLSVYTLDMKTLREKYHYLYLPKYDKDWLNFVANSRAGQRPWADYDCIEGGIADDRIIDLIEAYIAGTATAAFALKELSQHNPSHQICLLNQHAADDCLRFMESLLY